MDITINCHNQFQEIHDTSHSYTSQLRTSNQLVNIQHKIQSEIENGKIMIPQQSIPISPSPPNQNRRHVKKELMRKLQISKNKTLIDLYQLEQQQELLKKQVSKQSLEGVKSLQKSRFTAEEKMKIKRILNQMKVEQKQKQRKHQQIIEKFTKGILLEQQQQKKAIKQVQQVHREIAKNNLLSLQIRKKKRNEFQQQIKSQAKQIKRENYTYIENKRIDENLKLEYEEKRQITIKKLKEKYRFDIREVIAHSKQYQENRQKNREILRSKNKFQTQGPELYHFQKTKLTHILQEEDLRRKQQGIQKQKKPHQFRRRIQSFNEVVKQSYRPKLRHIPTHNSPQIKAKQSLNYFQRVKKGNQYLMTAKKNRKQRDTIMITEPMASIAYPNYLYEGNKNSRDKKDRKRQFNSIIQKSKNQEIEYEEVKKVTQLATQISNRSKKSQDEKVVEQIQRKLEVLKVLL